MAEVITYRIITFKAILPKALISPKSAILDAMEKNTSGATMNFKVFMNTVYIGMKRSELMPLDISAGRAFCITSPVSIPSTKAIIV